jgi:hypothetical protein
VKIEPNFFTKEKNTFHLQKMATFVNTTSNLTSGFVDLATYDEIEKYMYGGPTAAARFVRKVTKSTWFTQVPAPLTIQGGNPNFGQSFVTKITRGGDYLLYCWLRLTIPSVQATSGTLFGPYTRIRWTRNLMHNLIANAQFEANSLALHQFDNYFLDFWAAFMVPAGKRNAYNNMIGNIPALTNPPNYSTVANAFNTLPSYTLNLPLPFFFTRDSGVAYPTAATPYNEMTFTINFRPINQLLIQDAVGGPSQGVSAPVDSTAYQFIGVTSGVPLTNVQIWANYAIVSNDERKRMGLAPRDILIEQTQEAPLQVFSPATNAAPSFDLRFAHSVKALFFACQNVTNSAEGSNYTAASPYIAVAGGAANVNFSPAGATDPYAAISLLYENSGRLNMGVDYYSLINPFYHAVSVPLETGYHAYSYTLDMASIDPMGSTDYGKLVTVTEIPLASADAVSSASGHGTVTAPDPVGLPLGWGLNQTYQNVTVAVSNNVIRVSGGAVGFPVL